MIYWFSKVRNIRNKEIRTETPGCQIQAQREQQSVPCNLDTAAGVADQIMERSGVGTREAIGGKEIESPVRPSVQEATAFLFCAAVASCQYWRLAYYCAPGRLLLPCGRATREAGLALCSAAADGALPCTLLAFAGKTNNIRYKPCPWLSIGVI